MWAVGGSQDQGLTEMRMLERWEVWRGPNSGLRLPSFLRADGASSQASCMTPAANKRREGERAPRGASAEDEDSSWGKAKGL